MIKKNTPEWQAFIDKLHVIKRKSNREVLCIKCWQFLNCKQKTRHLVHFPDHKAFLLTSTKYASEEKICELAQGYSKIFIKNGEEYMISPFAPVNTNLLKEMRTNFGLQTVAGEIPKVQPIISSQTSDDKDDEDSEDYELSSEQPEESSLKTPGLQSAKLALMGSLNRRGRPRPIRRKKQRLSYDVTMPKQKINGFNQYASRHPSLDDAQDNP